jgi:probable F420-dependent oxidoreductase
MKFGVHLPQFGKIAGPQAITVTARGSETLGFDDLWVSDHQVTPRDQPYPPAFLLEPLLSLTWAAAATTSIGLGTSVMIVPQYAPVQLANAVATLDVLSGGRVTLGAGVGWLAKEFEALGQDYHTRGQRMDECLTLMRRCWEDDPISFHGRWYRVDDMRLMPKPAHRIPLWIGGSTEAAFQRGVDFGDGFHANMASTPDLEAVVHRLRRDRPHDITISVRCDWDGLTSNLDDIRATLDNWQNLGVEHVMATPLQRSVDDWLRSAETLAEVFERYR